MNCILTNELHIDEWTGLIDQLFKICASTRTIISADLECVSTKAE